MIVDSNIFTSSLFMYIYAPTSTLSLSEFSIKFVESLRNLISYSEVNYFNLINSEFISSN